MSSTTATTKRLSSDRTSTETGVRRSSSEKSTDGAKNTKTPSLQHSEKSGATAPRKVSDASKPQATVAPPVVQVEDGSMSPRAIEARKRNTLLSRITSGIRDRVLSSGSLDQKSRPSDSNTRSSLWRSEVELRKQVGKKMVEAKPVKSILKKSSSLRDCQGSVVSVNAPTQHRILDATDLVGSVENINLRHSKDGKENEEESYEDQQPKALGQGQKKHHSSAPDLSTIANLDDSSKGSAEKAVQNPVPNHPLRTALTQTFDEHPMNISLSNVGSKKTLSFQLDNSEVIPALSKVEYNRKPPPNMTFQRLDNKLRMEIREELNTFKRLEMQVHEDSVQNTVFH